MKYQVWHTCDQLGGRYPGDGIGGEETDSLKEARALAREYTARGQCGYVRRDGGGILLGDGSWSLPELTE